MDGLQNGSKNPQRVAAGKKRRPWSVEDRQRLRQHRRRRQTRRARRHRCHRHRHRRHHAGDPREAWLH
jgi:hypothetical protein